MIRYYPLPDTPNPLVFLYHRHHRLMTCALDFTFFMYDNNSSTIDHYELLLHYYVVHSERSSQPSRLSRKR